MSAADNSGTPQKLMAETMSVLVEVEGW